MVDERKVIRPIYNHIEDYEFDMQIRFMKLMAYLWKHENCECGMFRRDIADKGHRELMNINNWGPATKGPKWLWDFPNNRLKLINYWCHGCKKTFQQKFIKHTDQWIVDGMYKLFTKHNPELLEELFIIGEGDV